MSYQEYTFKLNNGELMPAIGLGTYEANNTADKEEAKVAVMKALEHGYRQFDCAHVYRNEKEIGQGFQNTKVSREDYFVTSKLWCNCHRAEDVESALDVTLSNLKLDYLDLYLMHWPYAFKSGSDPFPLDDQGRIIIEDTSIIETWKAMEKLVDIGKVKSIGVSNFSVPRLEQLLSNCKIVPAVNQVELHPYLPQNRLLDFCSKHQIHLTAYAPLGGPRSSLMTDDALIQDIAKKLNKSPAQVILSWGIQRGTSVVPKSSN
ncbi:hypothetical protein K7432_008013, partial [Basidiobolus ranarum]